MTNDYGIKKIAETKFLGVTIDRDLSWLSHPTSRAKNLDVALATGQLYRKKKYLPICFIDVSTTHYLRVILAMASLSSSKIKPVFTAQKHFIILYFNNS